MTRRSLWSAVVGLAAALVLVAARPTPPSERVPPVTVFAASSLTESLQAVATAWEARGGGAVTFSFDASSRLAKQIEAGAPADVFVSADRTWVDWLATRVRVERRYDLLGNTLVAVVRAGGAASAPTRPADLAAPAVRRLALAGENVPAGAYARAALQATGSWDSVKDRVVSGDNVRTALGWVATGEADVGIVYRTDAKVEPRVKEAFAFPAGTHPPIVYTGAALNPDGAAFLDFCAGAEAGAIFAAAGFTRAPGAAP
ncbi:MAG: molybdate ABC transporter substrate-binding protein [Myxococcota bacterium]